MSVRAGLMVAMAAAIGLAPARAAHACGGFFCSRAPVDQTAERIIFSVNPGGTITARVQIRYTGEPGDFAWLLPVPGVPELDVFPQEAFTRLDLATQPSHTRGECFAFTLTTQSTDSAAPEEPVRVLARQVVGPFDTVVLGDADSALVVQWLQDNGYRVTPDMVPLIEPYMETGMSLLAMKLRPGAEVTDIEPVMLTYEGMEPMIPLQLTAVAAEPEMGVLAYILADQRYAPLNYADVTVDLARLEFVDFNVTNYPTEVSRALDAAGGRGFVTEYAGPTDELIARLPSPTDTDEGRVADERLRALLSEHAFVTRLYGRFSAHEMTEDPTFAPAADQSLVDNRHDLSDPDDRYCSGDPCAFVYCGDGGRCVESLDPLGPPECACDAESTARSRLGDYGGLAVTCEPLSSDLGDPLADDDPCAGYDCGPGGECVAMNANPTCRCGELTARIERIDQQGTPGVVCSSFVLPKPDPPLVGGGWSADGGVAADGGDPEGGTSSGSRPRAARSDAGCRVGRPSAGGGGCAPCTAWLPLATLALGGRSRRRRGSRRPCPGSP